VATGHYGDHVPAGHAIEIEPGKDILVSYYRFDPGFSAGWHTHSNPFLAVVTKGTLEYYEGHHGRCEFSGRFSAGDAYYAIPGPGHKHLAGNYGNEPAEGYVIYLNVNRKYPVPMLGNQLDVNDFSPTPSPDCPRLRGPQV
jgi:quercetin dioxygenase-like cupin family protein